MLSVLRSLKITIVPDQEQGVKKAPNPRSGTGYGPEHWYAAGKKVCDSRGYRTWQHCRRRRELGGHSHVSCPAPSLQTAERSWCRSALLYCTETEGTQMNAKERCCRAGRLSCGSGYDFHFDADLDPLRTGIVFSPKISEFSKDGNRI